MTENVYRQARRLLKAQTLDMRAFIALLSEAAEAGHPAALENLGAWFLEGLRDTHGWIVRKDARQAVALFRRAGGEGNALAWLALGNCYSEGTGVRKDRREARRNFLKAYRGGVALGAMNIAALAADEGNSRLELAWLRRARAAGEAEATFAIAERALERRWDASRFFELVPELKRLARTRGAERTDAEELLRMARSHGLL